jgi:uncharacterized protein
MSTLRRIFGVDHPLIAMCHLLGLPGRPRHDLDGGTAAIVEPLARDLDALQDAGVDGVLFCNENDIPYQLEVGPEIPATMAAAIAQLRARIRVPFGVDILWDPKATLAVARATGAAFVREVFTGVYESDMGLMAPSFGDLAGYRHAIGAGGVAVFTNITPEFSRSVSGRPVADRARSAAFLGVDALLVSGQMAGVAAEMDDLRAAKEAAGDLPVLANTGVTHDNMARILEVADGVIVGTSLKVGGATWNAVDPGRARQAAELVVKARERMAVR